MAPHQDLERRFEEAWAEKTEHGCGDGDDGYGVEVMSDETNDEEEEKEENIRRIALIICSTRIKRIGPQLAEWLRSHLRIFSGSPSTPSPPSTPSTPNTPNTPNSTTSAPRIVLQTIDLATYLPTLPLSPNDPALPYYIPTPLSENPYVDEGTNAWSRLIRDFDGFVWLTPEYNFCFPAAVKIAVDGLFWEWAGRMSLVVSYGNEGGGKANAALRSMLKGVRVHEWQGKVELPLGYGESIEKAVKGELIPAVTDGWERDGKAEEVERIWSEMVELVGRGGGMVRGDGVARPVKVVNGGNVEKGHGNVDSNLNLKENGNVVVVKAGPFYRRKNEQAGCEEVA